MTDIPASDEPMDLVFVALDHGIRRGGRFKKFATIGNAAFVDSGESLSVAVFGNVPGRRQ